ncbi:nuclease-related domain-containing protein [Paenarthrobacter sp. Z7-10]|uniref:nuclease-related domain-containing protein n=1 Tax=Paenarthrobacter sp. Z7-10 TaxID=2787635 RepID=UPI0022A91CEF|nr:nuclease-related domain-containing protein [Paenarthrobacter sp. Z7-10]
MVDHANRGAWGVAAGDGASEQAQMAADRVARLKRQLQQAERDERAWIAGAAGEALVGEKLKTLNPSDWLVLHDVHWPGRPKANLDHVLVGPGGVLVIDAKNWTGRIEVREGVLFQEGRTRIRETIGVLEQVAALTVLLDPKHRQRVHGWLCMVRQPDMQAISSSGVRIQGLSTLTDAINALPNVLEPAEVQAIHAYLKQLLTGAASPSLLTSAQLGKAWTGNAKAKTNPRAGFQLSAPSRQFQAKQQTTSHSGQRSRPASSRARRPSKPQLGCLGVAGVLIFLLVFSSMLMNLGTSFTQQLTHLPPHPAPATTQPFQSP